MPSTYTNNLGLEKPATGEQAGTWGQTANFNYDVIDTGIDGNLSVSMAGLSGAGYQLQTGMEGGAPQPGVNKLIFLTGAQTAAGVVNIVPDTVQKIYFIQNQTTGGFAATIKQGTGTNVSLQAGYSAIVYSDGAGPAANVKLALDSPQFTNLMLTGHATVQGNTTISGTLTVTGAVNFGTLGVVQINQTVGIGIGMAPGHSLQLGGAVTAEIWLDTSDSTLPNRVRQVVWSSNGQPRWSWQTTISAESGANAGSDMQLTSFNDIGTPHRVGLFVGRASGNVAIGTASADAPGDQARLIVVGDNLNQTVLGVRSAVNQAAAVFLCQDATPQNLMAVTNAGDLRILGTFGVQRGATFYPGIVDTTYSLWASDGAFHQFHFAGGLLVGVI